MKNKKDRNAANKKLDEVVVMITVVPKEIISNITNDGRNTRALCKERKYNIPVTNKRKKNSGQGLNLVEPK